MKKKYQKKNPVMIDLSERKNLKIIEAEKSNISDDDIEEFKKQLEIRSKAADEFCEYYINKQLEANTKISEEEFNSTMKELLKQHKILKYLIKDQKE